jgi:uncharacterized membrane protein
MTAPSPDRPASLPGGFLDRGAQATRFEAFVDAAFAFAVTLLVISLDVPDSFPAMIAALKGVPAFAASFAQIMLFWTAHAAWSRRFGLDDAHSQRLSLLLVFLVLVYVYPLKILFSAFFAWITGEWLPPVARITDLADLQAMFIVYGIAFGTLSLCLAALYRHSLRAPVSPPLADAEAREARAEMLAWTYGAVVAVVSIVACLFVPENPPRWITGVPGLLYLLVRPAMRLARRQAGL